MPVDHYAQPQQPSPQMAPPPSSPPAKQGGGGMPGWLIALLAFIIVPGIAAGAVYFWQQQEANSLREELSQAEEQASTASAEVVRLQSELDAAVQKNNSISLGPIQFTCELSGGSFSDGNCVCPLEEGIGQTQDMMYDENTGFCQSTIGGPAGDAFAASIGLPYGDYAYYNEIIQYNCEESGGEFLNACSCAEESTYNQSTGRCEQI